MRQSKAYLLTIRSLFIAILILQSFVPFLGYIPLGIINLTIIQITVILGGILLGPKNGLFLGFSWGLIKWFLAYTAPSSLMDTMVFRNPIITIIPRMLVGWIAGLVFQWLYKKTKNTKISSFTTGIIGSLTNTVFVLSFIRIFASHQAAAVYHTSTQFLTNVLLGIAGTNGIPECIASAILVPILAHILFRFTKLKPGQTPTIYKY